jgi:glycosyltransferase involved in cell wall biosynthesis
VVEAASHGVPTVAYASAGGVCESVRDGVTGLLATDLDDYVARVRLLLSDPTARAAMAQPSRAHAAGLDWSNSQQKMERLVRVAALTPRPTAADARGGLPATRR